MSVLLYFAYNKFCATRFYVSFENCIKFTCCESVFFENADIYYCFTN